MSFEMREFLYSFLTDVFLRLLTVGGALILGYYAGHQSALNEVQAKMISVLIEKQSTSSLLQSQFESDLPSWAVPPLPTR